MYEKMKYLVNGSSTRCALAIQLLPPPHLDGPAGVIWQVLWIYQAGRVAYLSNRSDWMLDVIFSIVTQWARKGTFPDVDNVPVGQNRSEQEWFCRWLPSYNVFSPFECQGREGSNCHAATSFDIGTLWHLLFAPYFVNVKVLTNAMNINVDERGREKK